MAEPRGGADRSRWPTDLLLRRVHALHSRAGSLPVAIVLSTAQGETDGSWYLSIGQAEHLALELADVIRAAGGTPVEVVLPQSAAEAAREAELDAAAEAERSAGDMFAARRTARDGQ